MSLHKHISFVKSAIRIAGYLICGYGVFFSSEIVWYGFLTLVLSEVVGILEELGEK